MIYELKYSFGIPYTIFYNAVEESKRITVKIDGIKNHWDVKIRYPAARRWICRLHRGETRKSRGIIISRIPRELSSEMRVDARTNPALHFTGFRNVNAELYSSGVIPREVYREGGKEEDSKGEKRVEELDFTRFHLHNSSKCVRPPPLPRSPPIFKYGLTSNNISLSDTMSPGPAALRSRRWGYLLSRVGQNSSYKGTIDLLFDLFAERLPELVYNIWGVSWGLHYSEA